ncbi:MAG: metal-binding protein [Acidobacteriota bacterium]
MPSGRTHDLLTYALIPPSILAAHWYWGNLRLTAVATIAMVFAGLMFGPDLDIKSIQYKRWGPLRFIWSPYKVATTHRSRLSHGLLFSTIFRVLYFLVIVLLISTTVLYIRHRYLDGLSTSWVAEFQGMSDIFKGLWQRTGGGYLQAGLFGLWAGAAAHTVLDVTNSIARLIWKAF